MAYLFMVLIHLGGGVTILELEKGFWDSDKCIEYVSKLNGEAYCVPKYVEIGKVQNVNRR
tara:strand:- start:45 stop:224 length:180 start_codon:yes stop_codon:yes gene_type:complete